MSRSNGRGAGAMKGELEVLEHGSRSISRGAGAMLWVNSNNRGAGIMVGEQEQW